MSAQSIALPQNALAVAIDLPTIKKPVVTVKALDNIQQQVLAVRPGDTTMCAW